MKFAEPEQGQESERVSPKPEEVPADISAAQESLRSFSQIPLQISIELGRSTFKIRDLLEMKYHSVFQLDKPAGSNLDILVNGVLLGRGEVVVIEDRVRVKVSEIEDNN